MRNFFILSSMLLAACGGVNEDNFAEKYLEAYCGAGCTADITAICDAADATTETDGGTDTACEFDKAAAKACVDAENWTCEAIALGTVEPTADADTYPTPPADCLNVCGAAAE